jgi:hypothetical protein
MDRSYERIEMEDDDTITAGPHAHSPPEFRDEEGTRTIIWWVGLLQLTIGLIHNISIIVAQQVICWACNRIIMYMVL